MQVLPPFDKIGVEPVPPFVNASPQSGIAGSIVNGLIFNALQDELQNAIEGLGLTPTDSDYTQILQAISFGGIFIGTFEGAADALTATIPGSVVIPALKAGMRVTGFLGYGNATTSPELAVAGFTTGSAQAPIKRRDGTAVVAGDLVAGALITFRFDGTNWRVDGVLASDILAVVDGGSGSSGSASVSGQRSGLVSVNDGTSPTVKRNITATSFVVADSSGNTKALAGVSVSVNSSVTGAGGLDTGTLAANTVYYEWIIAQAGGANPTAVMSTSSTSPTLPSGYTLYGRCGGAAITDSSKYFYRITQRDRRAFFVVTTSTNTPALPVLAAGVHGAPRTSPPTWVAISLLNLVPTTAERVTVVIWNWSTNSSATIAVAPNANYGNATLATNPPPLIFDTGNSAPNAGGSIPADIDLESSNIYLAADDATTQLMLRGWTDNS